MLHASWKFCSEGASDNHRSCGGHVMNWRWGRMMSMIMVGTVPVNIINLKRLHCGCYLSLAYLKEAGRG